MSTPSPDQNTPAARPSNAKRYLFVMLLWADKLRFDLAAMPNLAAYKARVAARPGVTAAMRHEGLLAA